MFEPRLEGTIRDGLLDGRRVARHLREQVNAYASLWSNDPDAGAPTLAVMRVGDDPASQVYVRYKTRACEEVGIRSVECILPEDAPMEVVARQLQAWNADERVDGILVQLPLPAHLDKDEVIGLVDPAKDVDGFHPANLGGLMGEGAARTLHSLGRDDALRRRRRAAPREARDRGGAQRDRRSTHDADAPPLRRHSDRLSPAHA